MKLEDYAENLRPLIEVQVEKWMVNEPLYGWYKSIGIGKPGCLSHIRKERFHALDMGDHWLLHKEHVDPAMDPWGHLVHDAPHLLWGVGFGLLLAAFLSGSDE